MTTVHLPTGSTLREYDSWCLELVDALLGEHPAGHILWIDCHDHPTWKCHVALLLDGLVYDAWHPEVRLPPAEYVAEVFGEGTEWEIDPGADE